MPGPKSELIRPGPALVGTGRTAARGGDRPKPPKGGTNTMADHLDAPGLMSPNMDARIDVTDIYAFQAPDDPTRAVLILNVNPLAPTLATAFSPDAIYELKIDTN